jgi:hypothetical protein
MLLVAAKSLSDKTSRMDASLTQVIPAEDSGEPEMAELPESWKTLGDGTPAPNWVAALQEARHSEARAINEGSRSEMVPLPPGWGEMASGKPKPDVAAAVRRSRESH